MLDIFNNLVTAINNQTVLTQSIESALNDLEVGGGGGGPVGPIHASDVIYDNTTSGTSATEVQSSLDEIYALIGDVNTVLNSII